MSVLFSLLLAGAAVSQGTHPFSVHDMLAMQRVGDPQVSPDGRLVAFVLRTTDLEADRGRTDLWMAHVDGTPPRRFTSHEAGDSMPRWSPDGGSVYFLSSRSGSSQVFVLSGPALAVGAAVSSWMTTVSESVQPLARSVTTSV